MEAKRSEETETPRHRDAEAPIDDNHCTIS